MHWSPSIVAALLVTATPALSYASDRQLYGREPELYNFDPRPHLYARELKALLHARDADFDFEVVRRFAEAFPEPGVSKPKERPAGKTKSSISKDVKAKAQASTSGAQTGPPPPPPPAIPHDTRPETMPGHYYPPSSPAERLATEELPLPNTATPAKEPWYKTKKGATAAGFGAVSGAFGIASSQASPPYNHALGAASGAAGFAGAATYFLPGKRSLEILKSRNAVAMLHAKRSLEMLEQRDEELSGLLARHTTIEERNTY